MLSLRVELKTSRLLNGCSNQLSYKSFLRAKETGYSLTIKTRLKILNAHQKSDRQSFLWVDIDEKVDVSKSNTSILAMMQLYLSKKSVR